MSGFYVIWRLEPSDLPATVEELRAGESVWSALRGRQRARETANRHPGKVAYIVGPKGGLERVSLRSTR